jgi:cytochrome c oxidase assembly factor CtaG
MSWPRWTMIPYLALAMFQSLPLAAILTFSDRVIYAGYASIDDQARAGVIMWVPGSFPLLLPILRMIVELSSGRVVVEERHA